MPDATSPHADRATYLDAILGYSPPIEPAEANSWRASVAWALTQFDWRTLADRDLVPLTDDNLEVVQGTRANALVAEQQVLFYGQPADADSHEDALSEVGSWFGLDVFCKRRTATDGRILWDVRILREEGTKFPRGRDEEGRYHPNGYVDLEPQESPYLLWCRSQAIRAAMNAKAVAS